MAKMIPYVAKEHTASSKEDIIYEALSKLSDEYVVFHSLEITNRTEKGIRESEVDFLLFHPKKGVLIIEAKAGRIYHSDGVWYQGTPPHVNEMRHGGPFNQAKNNHYRIKDLIRGKGDKHGLLSKCHFGYTVCFPSIDKGVLHQTNLPPDSPASIVLTRDDLDNIEGAIERIYKVTDPNSKHVALDKREINYLLYHVFCPTFDLVPSKSLDIDLANQKFNQMLKEQSLILNFLDEQPSAIISGAAGTGKTMIAIEKARRHAAKGEKVLFLCYNRYLKDELEKQYLNPNIDFYTIDGLASRISKTAFDSFYVMKSRLEEIYENEKPFDYKHIIIDEGQDFGKDNIDEESIVDLLKMIIEERDGTFYIFYDKNQLVQAQKIPDYILDANTKLTLTKNCRNTYNIANTSMTLIGQEPKLHDDSVTGETPNLYIINNRTQMMDRLHDVLDRLMSKQIDDIVILTVKTETSSLFAPNETESNFKYRNKRIRFTSVRKFKGLEADAIIMIDVTKSTYIDDQLLFYVGSSRARLNLDIISEISEQEAIEVIDKLAPDLSKKNVRKSLATIIKSIVNS